VAWHSETSAGALVCSKASLSGQILVSEPASHEVLSWDAIVLQPLSSNRNEAIGNRSGGLRLLGAYLAWRTDMRMIRCKVDTRSSFGHHVG
jgi:hypothetical protein